MKILNVASETNPFIKSGGLGDVVFSLAKEMAKNNNVSIIIPFYPSIESRLGKLRLEYSFEVKMSWRSQKAEIYSYRLNRINFLFVKQDMYFNRTSMYGYQDDIERFSFFNLAVVEYLKRKSFDIVHVHDWQASLVPLLGKVNGLNFKSCLSIHNPAFQGNFGKEHLYDYLNLPNEYYENGLMRFHDYASFLKTGIMTVDKIITVSKTHRNELLNDLEAFNELPKILKYRENDFLGIVNGIDYDEFNPQKDCFISKQLDTDIDLFKVENKNELQREYNLPINNKPLFCIVSRLTVQKGIDEVIKLVETLVENNDQLFVLGLGDYNFQETFLYLENKYKNNIRVFLGFSNQLAHKLYASSDFLLMPSEFEPCGLAQLIAMRYGCVPIVNPVGGLNDTVKQFDDVTKTGNGFVMKRQDKLLDAYNEAKVIYNSKNNLFLLRSNCFKYDSSWEDKAKEYLAVYNSLINHG